MTRMEDMRKQLLTKEARRPHDVLTSIQDELNKNLSAEEKLRAIEQCLAAYQSEDQKE